MTTLAALLLGVAVMFITIALWPRAEQPEHLQFVEEEQVPRTLH